MKPWIRDIMPFLTDDDPAERGRICHSRMPLAEAAAAYGVFQRKTDGAVKIMLKPWA